jgi:hypothetical protein
VLAVPANNHLRTVLRLDTNVSEDHAVPTFRVKSHHIDTGRHNPEDHDLNLHAAKMQYLAPYICCLASSDIICCELRLEFVVHLKRPVGTRRPGRYGHSREAETGHSLA